MPTTKGRGGLKLQVIEGLNGGVIKAWVDGVALEDAARQQAMNLTALPFLFKRTVCLMPDVHAGKGSTVGCVFATTDTVIPAAVGVDIGCGVLAKKTGLKIHELPKLHAVRTEIEKRVPHGRSDNGGRNDIGAWAKVPDFVEEVWNEHLMDRYADVVSMSPGVEHQRAVGQLGTLGTGNHFIEVTVDENQELWVVLHSGSRGPGNKIGGYFTNTAKTLMKKFYITLSDPDLAYLPHGTPEFSDYITALHWAQDYALWNRRIMLDQVFKAIEEVVGRALPDEEMVECHHNFSAWEKHFGQNVLVTRKGAVRAEKGDMGIIPGSMGARTYIVRGLGNRDSFASCSHGAGRAMSRTAAKAKYTVEDLNEQMGNIESRRDADVIDEIPAAYKDIEDVMRAQVDLVEPVHVLKQIIVVKG